ncbi:hypothetical protein D9757_009968 [Collybiopsis confluens]|uniref:J domain-containing protein n=1 Tax=Collybiopsis confluens TaxID=2823264 RepID=A0A8H5LZ82_9AGAR|nr:hypothetical protein D9757_009968 [Collybiopsis confluens]
MSSSSSSSTIPSRPVIPHIITTCSSCQTYLEFPVPNPNPRQGTLLHIGCWKCSKVNEHAFYPTQIPGHYPKQLLDNSNSNANSNSTAQSSSASSSTPTSGARKGRRIGTQEKPLETGYYDLLGVPVTASTEDIKKAYRRLAIKHHPDKNPDDPQAEERFKAIAIAYQTLSDPDLRAKYNEFGPKESAPEGGYVDPEEVFSAIFGGERFVGIIGQISLARDMKAALQEAEEAEEAGDLSGQNKIQDGKGKPILSEEEKAKKDEKDRKKAAERAAARAERVNKLVDNLERKLGIFTESATGIDDVDVARSWRTICGLEAEELSHESYGPELLQAIGFAYTSKAKHFLATNQTFLGVGGWLHNVQGKYHVFSETVSTLRAAIELKAVFDQIQAAEKAGNLPPEERKKLEEQAAEKGLQALFKGAKLEIDSILREVCDRVLEDPNVSKEKAVLRAVALQMLGEEYAIGGGGGKGTAVQTSVPGPAGTGASTGNGTSAGSPPASSGGSGPGAFGPTPNPGFGHRAPSTPMSTPRARTDSHSRPRGNNTPSAGGLGGIGAGLSNFGENLVSTGRDIGSGIGGMFGFGASGSPDASPSARRASRNYSSGVGSFGAGGGGTGGGFDDSEYVRVDTRSSRARGAPTGRPPTS